MRRRWLFALSPLPQKRKNHEVPHIVQIKFERSVLQIALSCLLHLQKGFFEAFSKVPLLQKVEVQGLGYIS